MKKLLLFAALVVGFMTAQAAEDLSICSRHDGMSSSFYTVQVDVNDNGAPTTKSGIAMRVCRDADTLYFHNPFCSREAIGAKGVIKGTIDADNIITIPLDQVTYTYQNPDEPNPELRYWKVGMCYFEINEGPGYKNYYVKGMPEATQYQFRLDPETGVITSLEENTFMCEYEALADGRRQYLYQFGGNYTMTPYVPETIEVPEGAQYERYIYNYSFDGKDLVKVIDVAFHENKIYVEGILVDDAWMVGEIADGVVTFEPGQKLGIYSDQFVEYVSGEYLGMNYVTGAEEYASAPNLQMTISEDNKQLYFISENTVFMLTNGWSVLKVIKKPSLLYFNEIPATPADPELKDANIDNTWAGIEFYIRPKDVDGNFINPEYITYSVFLDNELYEFVPGIYNVMEAISEMPYGFCDYLGFDLYADGDLHRVFFYGELFKSIGVEVYYTVKGERRKSNRLIFGDDAVESIEMNKVEVESHYIDLNGRRIERPENGIYIKASKYEDGSVEYTKTLVRTR